MKNLSTDTHAIALIDTYFANKRIIDTATEENKEILAQMEKLTGGEDAYIGNHTFKKVERKGPVSYATIVKEHASHVDLEKYRGKPSVYFQVK